MYLSTNELWEHYKKGLSLSDQKLIVKDDAFKSQIYSEFKADMIAGDIELDRELLEKQYKEKYPNANSVKVNCSDVKKPMRVYSKAEKASYKRGIKKGYAKMAKKAGKYNKK